MVKQNVVPMMKIIERHNGFSADRDYEQHGQ
jgi:hypothetical protein